MLCYALNVEYSVIKASQFRKFIPHIINVVQLEVGYYSLLNNYNMHNNNLLKIIKVAYQIGPFYEYIHTTIIYKVYLQSSITLNKKETRIRILNYNWYISFGNINQRC